MNRKLSVVICVYNEAENIIPLIERLTIALNGIDHEMVFVDDGSTDNTLVNLKIIKIQTLRLLNSEEIMDKVLHSQPELNMHKLNGL